MNAETFPPGEFLKDELEARNWTQVDLAKITGKSARLINEVINVKRSVTPDTAKSFAAAFGTSAELWMNLESSWQLSLLGKKDVDIRRRAALYDKFPISRLVQRGWIPETDSIDVLESNVFGFFGIKSVDERPQLAANFRRSNDDNPLNPIQLTWFYRSYRLAERMPASDFRPSDIDECISELKQLMGYPESTREIPKLLAQYGIRFVVVEQLAASKIDGVCFWLNDNSPVISVSLRIGRVDNFWFTLMHEISHLKHRDYREHPRIDVDMFSDVVLTESLEARANSEAAENIVAKSDIDSFIARVSPLYSAKKIRGFANRIDVWPGLVVGRLQHLKQIPYSSFRAMLPDVRSIITSSALTDGWGYQIT